MRIRIEEYRWRCIVLLSIHIGSYIIGPVVSCPLIFVTICCFLYLNYCTYCFVVVSILLYFLTSIIGTALDCLLELMVYRKHPLQLCGRGKVSVYSILLRLHFVGLHLDVVVVVNGGTIKVEMQLLLNYWYHIFNTISTP